MAMQILSSAEKLVKVGSHSGRTNISGSKIKTWRDSDRIMDLAGWPVAWK